MNRNFKIFLKVLEQLFGQRLFLAFKLGLSLGLFACTIIDPYADTTPPTLTISIEKLSLEKNIPNKIIFTFSEDVSNFTSDKIKFLGDVTVNKGEFITNNLSKYFLDITPKGSGDMTVMVPAYTVQDEAGNFNLSNFTTSFLVKIDSNFPKLSISIKPDLQINITSKITFTFNEAVTGFTENTISLYGPTADKGVLTTVSDLEYTLSIIPRKTGTLIIKVLMETIKDNSGRTPPSDTINRFKVSDDTTPPTLTISTNSPLEKDVPVDIFFIFNEDVTDLTLDDIEISGVKVDKIKFTTNSKKKYKWNIIPRGKGKLKITIPAGVQDLTGNPTATDFTIDIPVSRSGSFTHTISFIPNGARFLHPKITTLKVVKGSRINKNQLNKILSYPPTGPKPNIQAVTREIFEWQFHEKKYDFDIPPNSDITLEAVWSNSCGKVETFHPENRYDLQTHIISTVNSNLETDLNHIDTSAITDMRGLFHNNHGRLEKSMACWNTSKVRSMRYMFADAINFNQDIGKWDVSKVVDMTSMFADAVNFNQDIGKWDVSKVVDMINMFAGAISFNQNIGKWDVSSVKNMNNMFWKTVAFNQDIRKWDVANVKNMNRMFWEASSFNQDISKWNVAKVKNMNRMFWEASSFNQDIGKWNVAKVTNMSYMFGEAINFNQDISKWNVAKVTDMSYMFWQASSFNQDISKWNVAKVTSWNNIFYGSAMIEKNKPIRFK